MPNSGEKTLLLTDSLGLQSTEPGAGDKVVLYRPDGDTVGRGGSDPSQGDRAVLPTRDVGQAGPQTTGPAQTFIFVPDAAKNKHVEINGNAPDFTPSRDFNSTKVNGEPGVQYPSPAKNQPIHPNPLAGSGGYFSGTDTGRTGTFTHTYAVYPEPTDDDGDWENYDIQFTTTLISNNLPAYFNDGFTLGNTVATLPVGNTLVFTLSVDTQSDIMRCTEHRSGITKTQNLGTNLVNDDASIWLADPGYYGDMVIEMGRTDPSQSVKDRFQNKYGVTIS